MYHPKLHDDIFYQCKLCKVYTQGKSKHKQHKIACQKNRQVPAPKIQRIDSSGGVRSQLQSIEINKKRKLTGNDGKGVTSSEIISSDIADQDTETEECILNNNYSDEESSIIIESVVGNVGVTYKAQEKQLHQEMSEEQDKNRDIPSSSCSTQAAFSSQTIPVLMEKIKVEPPDRVDTVLGTSQQRIACSKDMLRVRIEPIADAIRKHVFKHPRTEFDPSKPTDNSRVSVTADPAHSPAPKKRVRFEDNCAPSQSHHTTSQSRDTTVNATRSNTLQREEKVPTNQSKQGQAIGIIVGAWEIYDDGEDIEKLSPAASYIKALNATHEIYVRKQKEPESEKTRSPHKDNSRNSSLPGHISVLTDDPSKPVFKCNFCHSKLFNETQFIPHKYCQFEVKPKPKGKKKRYCICDNTYEGIWKIPMIQCTFCRKWYHGKCMGLSDEHLEKYPPHKAWLCFKCKAKNLKNGSPVKTRNGISTDL